MVIFISIQRFISLTGGSLRRMRNGTLNQRVFWYDRDGEVLEYRGRVPEDTLLWISNLSQ